MREICADAYAVDDYEIVRAETETGRAENLRGDLLQIVVMLQPWAPTTRARDYTSA